jgi:hypothetical protein
MQEIIALPLRNFELTSLVLSFIAAAVSLACTPAAKRDFREELLAYFLLFGTGLGFFYSGIMHIFFGSMVAQFIGWPDSPFQTEVGFASFGFAVVAFLSFRGSFGLRLAAVVGPSVFLLGAAVVHIMQMVTAGNFTAGNAGIAFLADLIGPGLGYVLLWLRYRAVRPAAGSRHYGTAPLT